MSYSPGDISEFEIAADLPDPATGVLGPCDWNPLFSDCGEDGTCTHVDSLHPDLSHVVQQAGVTWLWNATFRHYGNCPVTILPCLKQCSGYGSYPAWVPYRTSEGWVNVSCGTCGSSCSCSSISEIVLPTVGTVSEVSESGVVLDATEWRLDNHRYLLRLGGDSWPACQDLNYEDEPTLSVTYTPGHSVPSMGQLAAGTLICQLARRLCGAKCDLPANATTVSRQGVSIALDSTTGTGLWIIDQWVEMVNRAVSKVWAPSLRPPFVTSPV